MVFTKHVKLAQAKRLSTRLFLEQKIMTLDYEEIKGVSCMVVRENGKYFVSYNCD
ncbi:hypothetical protein PRUB_b0597 [Pseudoalteromonas rubra]|uniref:Uncharacterized protein n=1 Tax=Pseudoalteromonas rubra TaxID=43658 RepID=A0A8T0C0D4_9GAMM|nr:hypothetical protein PRUB_b0597 [Pseudoalteromonas rubra]